MGSLAKKGGVEGEWNWGKVEAGSRLKVVMGRKIFGRLDPPWREQF